MARSFVKGTLQMATIDENKKEENISLGHVVAIPYLSLAIQQIAIQNRDKQHFIENRGGQSMVEESISRYMRDGKF